MRTHSAEAIACQPASIDPEFRRELNKLSDLAFVFLNATDGDKVEAKAMLESFIDLLFEGGAFSTWRYRILVANIREGL
jgi:hypothetical protein